MCVHEVETGEPLVAGDARAHPIFRDRAAVAALGVAAYAGVPLATAEGHVLGSFAVMDVAPRDWTAEETAVLVDLAGAVMTEITLRRERVERRRAEAMLREEIAQRDQALTLVDSVLASAPVGFAFLDHELRYIRVNESFAAVNGVPIEAHLGRTGAEVVPDIAAAVEPMFRRILETGEPLVNIEVDGALFGRPAETRRWLASVYPVRGRDGSLLGIGMVSCEVTAQRRAEEALRESEARYRTLVETAHEGVWVVDQVGTTTYVNPRLCQMLGYAPAELLGRPIFDCMPADAAFQARTLFARRQRGIAEVQELTFRRRDGSELFALVSTSPLVDGDGAFAGALAMVTDITERRRAEQALRESEARYRHIAANAPGVVYQFVYRPDGSKGFTFASEGARALFGVAPESILRDPAALFGLIHPEDRLEFHASGLAAVAALVPWRWQGRAVLATGEVRWVQVASRNERQPDGSIVCDGLLMDVTELRRAATLLEESEARFRLATRATNDVVYDWDITTDEHFWGETLIAAFGYHPRQIEATNDWWAERVHPDDAPRVIASLRGALDGDAAAWSEEYRFRRSDGSYATVLDRGYLLRDEGGRAARMVGSMIDLTERKELEAQLRQAQKMEAVGQLAGGVAHDFNNLLTVIKVHAELALEELGVTHPLYGGLHEIHKAAARAATLTRQLLAFSRKQLLQPRVLDLNAVVAELEPMLRRLIGENIDMAAIAHAFGAWVMADRAQIEQVLMNLAINARDAMPEGGTLIIATSNIELDDRDRGHPAIVAPGAYVTLAVTDTGSG
ncbi:MAG TPA: PAS domain S-box protein, partial [Gemmatimonadaceae bacterium]